MHPILQRQTRKYLDPGWLAQHQGKLQAFFDAVDAAYVHNDEDRELVERSLELSSHELLAINTLLRSTLESTVDGILVVDASQRIVLYNKRFVEMWRIPQEVMDTRDDNKALDYVLSQLVHPDAFLSKVRELYKSGQVSFDVLDFLDGRVFERYSQPLIADKKIAGRVWSFRDVTGRVKADRELKERAEELEKINKLMIGRELKMTELKQELKRLQAAAKR